MLHKSYKLYLFFFLTLTLLSISFLTVGCADEPNSLGKNFLTGNETTGVKIFDSYSDSMLITSVNKKIYENTSASGYLLVGSKGSYNSKSLIKFRDISPDYDSATVSSVKLTLNYRNYYYPSTVSDSLGQISFDIYSVIQNLNYSSVTFDSVTSSAFGTTSHASYTGSPSYDTQKVIISLPTSLAKDWLEYAADTNYSVKNYGIAMSPNASSDVIKGFFSNNTNLTYAKPTLTVIVTKNGDTDTLTYNNSETVFLADGTVSSPNETFSIQAGIGYAQLLKFDFSHFPQTATINDAQIFLTLDRTNSNLSTQSLDSLVANVLTDTTGKARESITYLTYKTSGNNDQYIFRIIIPLQKWARGEPNYGLLVRPLNQILNFTLSQFAFYDVNASDPSKRPRVIIKYTPRITP